MGFWAPDAFRSEQMMAWEIGILVLEKVSAFWNQQPFLRVPHFTCTLSMFEAVVCTSAFAYPSVSRPVRGKVEEHLIFSAL